MTYKIGLLGALKSSLNRFYKTMGIWWNKRFGFMLLEKKFKWVLVIVEIRVFSSYFIAVLASSMHSWITFWRAGILMAKLCSLSGGLFSISCPTLLGVAQWLLPSRPWGAKHFMVHGSWNASVIFYKEIMYEAQILEIPKSAWWAEVSNTFLPSLWGQVFCSHPFSVSYLLYFTYI